MSLFASRLLTKALRGYRILRKWWRRPRRAGMPPRQARPAAELLETRDTLGGSLEALLLSPLSLMVGLFGEAAISQPLSEEPRQDESTPEPESHKLLDTSDESDRRMSLFWGGDDSEEPVSGGGGASTTGGGGTTATGSASGSAATSGSATAASDTEGQVPAEVTSGLEGLFGTSSTSASSGLAGFASLGFTSLTAFTDEGSSSTSDLGSESGTAAPSASALDEAFGTASTGSAAESTALESEVSQAAAELSNAAALKPGKGPGGGPSPLSGSSTTVTIGANDANAAEQSLDTGQFTVYRNGDTSQALTVSFSVSGTATVTTDYTGIPNLSGSNGSVTIGANQSSATITVTPLRDNLVEGNETVIVSLTTDAGGYQLGTPSSATVTIADDPAVVTISANDASAAEASSNTGQFTISRSGGDTTQALSVSFSVSGTATVNTDYTGIPNLSGSNGSVTIAANQTTATITVTPLQDNLIEGNETVILTLAAVSGVYQVGSPSNATVTIADDPAVVTISANDPNAAESSSNTGQFTVSRSGGDVTQALTVSFSVGGTATVNTDYTGIPNLSGSNGSVTIGANQSSATITVTPLQDNVIEGNETVVLTLAAVSGVYQVGSPSNATVTIADDPAVVTITANDAGAAEAGSNTGQFTISRSGGDVTHSLTVNFGVSGTATVSTDYTGIPNLSGSNGSVTIAANQTSATVTITPLQDNLVEGNETVLLTLAAVSGVYQVGTPSSATVTIADDPPVVTITATDPTAAEYGPNTGQFTVSRSGGDVTQALTVNLSVGGTATRGGDYTGLSNGSGSTSWVSIAANQSDATLTVTPVQDTLVEGSESILVGLATGSNYQIGTPSSATVTLVDDDTTAAAPVLQNPGNQTSIEGSFLTLLLRATDINGDPITFSASGLPLGLSINPVTGLIDGVPGIPDGGSASYSVTVTVSDGVLSSSGYFTWLVQRTVIESPGDQASLDGATVELIVSASNALGNPLSFSATGLPSGLNIDTQSGIITGTIAASASASSPYSVTVTATDGAASASTSFDWVVSNVTIASPADQFDYEGADVWLPIEAADAEGGTLTYSASGLPDGLSIDTDTGEIAGTLDSLSANDSPYTVTVSASDGTHSASTTFTWDVVHIELASPGDQLSVAGDSVLLPLFAFDPEGDSLTYSASGLPTGLTIDTDTGDISGTVASSAISGSPHTVSVSASDGDHTASVNFTWEVLGLWLDNPGTQVNATGDSVELHLSASDPDNDPLSYNVTGLPAGLGLDTANGVIIGAVKGPTGSPYTVEVTATDGTHSVSQAFTWFVTNDRVTLTSPGNQSSHDDDIVELALTAVDIDGDPVQFYALGLPAGLALDSESGRITGIIAPGAADYQGGVYHVTLLADDGLGDTDSLAFTWTVTATNHAPALLDPEDRHDVDGAAVSFAVFAYDLDDDDLTFSASGLPSGLSIATDTGEISGTLSTSASSGSPYTVTVSVSDGTATDSASFDWEVTNVLVAAPEDQANMEGDSVELHVAAIDGNNDTLSYSASGLPSGLTITSSTGIISGTLASLSANDSPYTVTVSASDSTHSDSATFTWVVTHIDMVGPGVQSSTQGEDVFVTVYAADPDNDPLTFSATGLPDGLSIDEDTGEISGTLAATAGSATPYAVTVSATDGGHTASVSFDWTVNAVALTAPDVQDSIEGETVSVTVDAVEGNNQALTYSAVGLPDGLSIDEDTGEISGTLATGTALHEPYEVKVTAGNGDQQASATFQWFVGTLRVVGPGFRSDDAGSAVSFQIDADSSSNATLTYAVSGLPAGLSLNTSTGEISGTLSTTAARPEPYFVALWASDGTQTAVDVMFWEVTEVSLDDPSDQVDAAGASVSLALAGFDPEGENLTYGASGLPSGLSVDTSTGVISGTISSSAGSGSPYTVTVSATDGYTTATQTFSWIVTNGEVDVTNPGSQSANEGDVVSLGIEAVDGENDPLNFMAEGLPPGLVIDEDTGIISGTVGYAGSESGSTDYLVTVLVADGNGESGSIHFLWTLDDVNPVPVVTDPGSESGTEGDFVELQIVAADADGDALHYSATSLPDGLDINPYTGVISGILSYDSALGSPYSVTVTADDGDTSDSATFSWAVSNQDLRPLLRLREQTSVVGETVSLQLAGSDPDGDALTYSVSGLPPGLSATSAGVVSGTVSTSANTTTPYTVTVTVSDGVLAATDGFFWFVEDPATTPVIQFVDAAGRPLSRVVPFSVEALDRAIEQHRAGGPDSRASVNRGYGPNYIASGLDAVSAIADKAFRGLVRDTSGQVANSLTVFSEDAMGRGGIPQEVALRSLGGGAYETEKPILVYEGRLTQAVQGLLGKLYILVPLSEVVVLKYRNERKVARPFRMVAVGDSITAGMQDGTIFDVVQRDSYGAQLAAQNALTFGLPLISGPRGIGGSPRMRVYAPQKAGDPWSMRFVTEFRINQDPTDFPNGDRILEGGPAQAANANVNNFAVPGVNINELLTRRGNPNENQGRPAAEQNFWNAPILRDLGTQIVQARGRAPSLVLFWAGNNDGLRPVVNPPFGVVNDRLLTPLNNFRASYAQALRDLKARLADGTTPDLVVATLPDVGVVPVLRPLNEKVEDLARGLKLPFKVLVRHDRMLTFTDITNDLKKAKLDLQNAFAMNPPHEAGSKVNFFGILQNTPSASFRNPPPGMDPVIRFAAANVMDPMKLRTISDRIRDFNAAIRALARAAGLPVVDVDAFFKNVVRMGGMRVDAAHTLRVTLDGGIVSYDGFHPGRTAQAVLANLFLEAVNEQLKAGPGAMPTTFGGLSSPLATVPVEKVLKIDRRVTPGT